MKSRALVLTAIALSLLFATAWLAWGFYGINLAAWATGDRSVEKAGQWGDSYGAFNALISSLGFCAVALTLWSQSKSLDHQQRSLDIQQKELKQQQDDQYRQRFETTFFELLRLHRQCRDEFSYKGVRGLLAFRAATDELNLWETNRQSFTGDLFEDYRNSIHREAEATLSPYFRVIYRILDRLRVDTVLSPAEKTSYAKLLRGQISSSELVLIGVNGKMSFAKDTAQLIEDYRLLKYVPEGAIKARLAQEYAPHSFLGHEPIGPL